MVERSSCLPQGLSPYLATQKLSGTKWILWELCGNCFDWAKIGGGYIAISVRRKSADETVWLVTRIKQKPWERMLTSALQIWLSKIWWVHCAMFSSRKKKVLFDFENQCQPYLVSVRYVFQIWLVVRHFLFKNCDNLEIQFSCAFNDSFKFLVARRFNPFYWVSIYF